MPNGYRGCATALDGGQRGMPPSELRSPAPFCSAASSFGSDRDQHIVRADPGLRGGIGQEAPVAATHGKEKRSGGPRQVVSRRVRPASREAAPARSSLGSGAPVRARAVITRSGRTGDVPVHPAPFQHLAQVADRRPPRSHDLGG